MIKLERLSAGYSGKTVLENISLEIPAGKVTVIVGPNGCGKSTLLKALVGINPHSGGEILVDGQNIRNLSSQQIARKIAYLAQSKKVPDISALRMVLHGRFPYLRYPRRYSRQDMDIARAAMEKMGIAHLAEENLSALSGGTRQRVYIAMALAQDTPAILMDEPTTYLDVASQLQMMEQARDLADEGKAVVLVLHDLAMALQCADRMAVLSHGKLVQWGEPKEVYRSGCLDEVFGISVKRFATEDGWQYYYKTNENRR